MYRDISRPTALSHCVHSTTDQAQSKQETDVRFSIITKLSQRGAAMTEFIVVLPMLLLIALGCIQWAFIYQAKVTVDHAAFMSARAGATSGMDIGQMRRAFAKGILPLYSPDKDALMGLDVGAGFEAWKDAQHWASVNVGGGATQLLILNPTREAFDDFGEQFGSDTIIRNDRLHLKSQSVVGASNVSIQDANLLKVHVLYGYEMQLPFIKDVLAWIGVRTSSNVAKQAMWRAGRIPVLATSTVRMQSNAKLNGNVLAMAEIDQLLESDSLPIINGQSYDGHRPWDMGPSGGSSDIPDIGDLIDPGYDDGDGDSGDPSDPGDDGTDPGDGDPGDDDTSDCAPGDIGCLINGDPGVGDAVCEVPGDEDPGDDPGFTPFPTNSPGFSEAPVSNRQSPTSQAMSSPAVMVGNPINIVNGNKYQREVDLRTLPGPSSLQFVRHYNSRVNYNGVIGHNWRHTYDVTVQPVLGSEPAKLRITQSDGRTLDFTRLSLQPTTNYAKPQSIVAVYRSSNPQEGTLIDRGKQGYDWLRPSSAGVSRTLEFNQPGYLTRIVEGRTDAVSNHSTQLLYDGSGKQLMAVIDDQQRRLSFAYDKNDRLRELTDPAGNKILYRYSKRGNLQRVSYVDEADKAVSRVYHYEDKKDRRNLTGITDERGVRFATYAYDQYDRAILSTHADDVEKVTIEYGDAQVLSDDPNNIRVARTTKVTDSLGRTSEYLTEQRHGVPLVMEIRGPGCSSCGASDVRYEYNDNNQVTAIHQKDGSALLYSFDSEGRRSRTERLDPQGVKTLVAEYQFTRSGQGTTASVSRPSINLVSERRLTQKFDRNGQLVATTETGYSPRVAANSTVIAGYTEIARTVRMAYNKNGQLEMVDGPRDDLNDITRYQYDDNQRVTTVTQPDGRQFKILQFNAYGDPAVVQFGEQSPIYLSFNRKGQLLENTIRNRSSQYIYDDVGNLSSVIGPDGNQMEHEYDDAGRLVAMQDSKGFRTERTLDSENRILNQSVQSPYAGLIKRVSAIYDTEDRVVRTELAAQMASGSVQTSRDFEYSGQELFAVTNEQGQQLLNNTVPTSQAAAENTNTSGHSGHAARQRVTVADAKGNTTEYTLDDFGRVVLLKSPDTGITRFNYDHSGNAVVVTEADGATTTLSYDAANRITRKAVTSPTISEEKIATFSYDINSGKIAAAHNANSSERYIYDTEGFLTQHIRTIDGHEFTTHYEFDDNDRLMRKTLPDGQHLRYHYHVTGHVSQGQLRAITREGVFGLQSTVIGELNQSQGLEDRVTFHNGITTVTTYSAAGEVVAINSDKALQLAYNYTAKGDISGIDINGSLQQYQYDPLGRLIEAKLPSEQHNYHYDESGNQVLHQITDSDGRTKGKKFVYAQNSNQLHGLAVFDQLGTQSAARFGYDSIGNTSEMVVEFSNTQSTGAKVGRISYEYDADGNLSHAYQNGELLAQYSYNSWGQRIKKVSHSQISGNKRKVTYYLYDGTALTAEVDEQGAIVNQYVYYKEKPIIQLHDKQLYAIHTDQIGTPQSVTDSDQKIVWQATYTPFGYATVASSASKHVLNLRLPGQYFDQETHTHYNYHRQYDPKTGRYLSSDPIGLRDGLNTYAYVHNNPINAYDPLGLYRVVVGFEVNNPAAFAGGVHDLSVDYGHAFFYLVDDNNAITNIFSFGPAASMTAIGQIIGVPGTLDYPITQDVSAFAFDINFAQYLYLNARINAWRADPPSYWIALNNTCAESAAQLLDDWVLNLGLPDGASPIAVPPNVADTTDSLGITTGGVTNIDMINPYALHQDMIDDGFTEINFDPWSIPGLIDPATGQMQIGVRDPTLPPNSNPTPAPDNYEMPDYLSFMNLNVLGNDTDPDGEETLTVTSVDPTSAAGGTLTILPNGRIRYTPPAGFLGTDTFSYVVTDPWGGTSIATVTIEVVDQDPPIIIPYTPF